MAAAIRGRAARGEYETIDERHELARLLTAHLRVVSDHLEVFVPSGRVTSPIPETNWEGVGVAPDIPVSSGKALLTAHVEAVRTLKKTAADERQQEALETLRRR